MTLPQESECTIQIKHLTGKCFQTFVEFDGFRFWVGADYYPVSDGYRVSYKAGFVKSWFAVTFDYGPPVKHDEIIQCSEQDIDSIVKEKIEKEKFEAAERCLEAAYSLKFYFETWMKNGNEAYAKAFKEALAYQPHDGVCDSILVSITFRALDLSLYCHVDVYGKNIQVLGTTGGRAFVKAIDIPIPDQYEGDYTDLISGYIQSSDDLTKISNIVMHFSLPLDCMARGDKQYYHTFGGTNFQLWPE